LSNCAPYITSASSFLEREEPENFNAAELNLGVLGNGAANLSHSLELMVTALTPLDELENLTFLVEQSLDLKSAIS
jgi:hypothetical protein